MPFARRMLVPLALLVADCGMPDVLRAQTGSVPAILTPSCGTAACHSPATGREGLVFGTIEEGCESAIEFGLTAYISGDGASGTRMPLDGPLPQADIDLIAAWEANDWAGCP